MQEIKWFCDKCKQETNSLATISIGEIKNKSTRISPTWNGIEISDGISWKPSISYDVCNTCYSKVKELLTNV